MTTHHPRLSGIAVGLIVTLQGTLYFFGPRSDHALELYLYDLRMRECNRRQPAAPITHIDIDDNSLQRVGRWPWRRDQFARLIRVLKEVGSRTIAVDILLSEPERPLVDDPRYTSDWDIEPLVPIQGSPGEGDIIYGDRELAAAIRAAGNVFLPVQVDLVQPRGESALRVAIARLRTSDSSLTVEQALAVTGLRDLPENRRVVERELFRRKMAGVLFENYALTEDELATILQATPQSIADVVAGVKTEVANALVAPLLTNPPPKLDTVLEKILGNQKDRNNPDRQDIKTAYRRQLGLAALREMTRVRPPGTAGPCLQAFDVEPAHFLLAQAAQGIGAVNFLSDSDGTTRRVPLMTQYGDRMINHLGFAVACETLGLDPAAATLSDDRWLTIPRRTGEACRVPVDAHGNLLIPWTGTARNWREYKDFPHLSAAHVWTMVDAQQQIDANRRALAYAYADVVRAVKGDLQVTTAGGPGAVSVPGDQAYRLKVNEQIRLERQIHHEELGGKSVTAETRNQLEALRAELAREQQAAAAFVRRTIMELAEISAEDFAKDTQLRADAERFRAAQRVLETDITSLTEANCQLEASIQATKDKLESLLRDRYVFVGYAATAEGDIVKTPIDPRTIGVMCHAQVLNAFLQNSFIRQAPRWLEAGLCLALGLVCSVVTAVRGPRLALLTVVGLLTAYTIINAYLVFMVGQVWLALAGILITTTAVWAVVTLFRQLTAERERRIFAKQLSQYTAPAIATRLAANPQAAQAFKAVQTREMTLFFNDLVGFTTITEQASAEVIQRVLNLYLERMTQTIWRHGGLVSKFMGDGIMAFFNSSVDPLPHHPQTACETCLDVLWELERLKEERRGDSTADLIRQLNMRIGLASGTCKNGDFGSDLKADYTAIGDVVNLAARLESANKVFGTKIMVSGPTRDAVSADYEFRYLADLQVKGKNQTVPVYELVCRKGELTLEQQEYIQRFEAGVELYKQRRWDECIVSFTRLLARRFDDLGAGRYIEACQEYKIFPPDQDWVGALELKEK